MEALISLTPRRRDMFNPLYIREVREPEGVHVPADIPRAGLVVSTILSMLTVSVLAVCFTRRVQSTTHWSRLPLTRWLILAIYADSIVFIFTTSILEHGFGLNSNMTICDSAILLCLVCYMSTKVVRILIYYFLVEKVYIIRSVSTPRLQSKLYLLNCFGMLLPYCVVVILNFVYRTAYFDKNGTCIIGMEMKAMMPLIIFDAVVNFYLTLLFVIPLRSLYSYKNSPNSVLRTIALRSFVGSLATLTSSVVNLTVLMVLRGEAAWICLMCCNADILFSVLVLHWVTSKDSNGQSSSNNRSLSLPHNSALQRKINMNDDDPVSPNSLIDRLDNFDVFGSPKGIDVEGTVTTKITARKMEDDVVEIGDGKKKRGSGRSKQSGEDEGYPMRGIKIQVGRVVEVEDMPRNGRGRGSEGDDIVDFGRTDFAKGDGTSTEDLVRKQ